MNNDNNLHLCNGNSSGLITSPGTMIFHNTTRLIFYMSDEQAGVVFKKFLFATSGQGEDRELKTQMQRDGFNDMLNGAIASHEGYIKKLEGNRRGGKKSGEIRRANSQRLTELKNTNQNEVNFNSTSSQLELNKTNQNKTNQSDRQIKGAAGDMANQQLNSNQSATSQQTVSHRQPISNSQQRVNSEAITLEGKIAALQELLDITPASDQKRRGEIRKEIETLRGKRQQMAQSAANQQAARMPKVNTTYVSGQADDSDVPEF